MPVGYTPIYRIDLDGIDITDRFNDRVTELHVTLSSGSNNPDTCVITLDDRDWRIASPQVGRKIEVYLGYKEVGLAQQNVFEIKTVEYFGPPRGIRISGTSVGFIGTLKAPAIKDFDNKTLGDIIGDIAKKGGVAPMVETGLAQMKVPFLNQTSSSLHLLQELERRYGAVAKFHNGKLAFIPRDSNTTLSGLTAPVLLLKPGHLANWSVRHDKRGEYSGVRAAYRDKDTNQPKWIEEANKLFQPQQGEENAKNPYRFPKIFNSLDEAQQGMKSMVSALNRSMGEVNLTLSQGDPWIRDQQFMLITGMRDGINGQYQNDTVTHVFTKGEGLLTTILAKPPGGEGIGDDSAPKDDKVFTPSPGSKLGTTFVPPVFDDV